jgi:hypothetical protein
MFFQILSEELEVVVVKLSRLQLNVGVDKLAEEEGWTVSESIEQCLYVTAGRWHRGRLAFSVLT